MEASGKTLVEAKETVFDLLGVAEEDAEIVVLSEPKSGLFGRVRGEARVQARVRPKAPPAKRGRRQRSDRKGSSRKEDSAGGGVKDDLSPARSEGSAQSRRKQPQVNGTGVQNENGSSGSQSRSARSREKQSSSDMTTPSGPGLSAGGERERPKRSGGSGSKGRSPSTTTGELDRKSSGSVERTGSGIVLEERESDVEESLTLQEQGDAAKQFVEGLLREFGTGGSVTVREIDPETVEVAATGPDLGLLVGPKGVTLNAVQDLARTFVQRQSENRTDRILVDIGGYREKRSAALRRFTEGIVVEVQESGVERLLEPMNAADRKVVHDAVNDLPGVSTRSEGDEPQRYVVISPDA